MRILYIVNDLAYFRAHRENIALAMAKEGHGVFVASGDYQGVDISDWPSNITLLPLELNKHTLDPRTDVELVRKLRAFMAVQRPDIVHAITIKPILMSALAAQLLPNKVRSKIKFVWTFPGLGKMFEKTDQLALRVRKSFVTQVLRYCAHGCDVSVTFENPSDRDIIVQHKIVSKDRTHVLWGAGLAMGEYKSVRPDRGTHPLVFLMATRLIKKKGVDTYLQASKHFFEHPAQPQFLLAGIQDPSNPDNVDMADIEAANEAGHIDFLGAVSGIDMPALYNRSDVMCLPTRLREGFPRSLLEAAACGCALIASDQTSIRQVLKEGETGWLLPNANTDELKQVIKTLLEQPKVAREIGQKTADFIHSLPVSNENISRGFQQIYGAYQPPEISDSREV